MSSHVPSVSLWSPVCLRLLEWRRIGKCLRCVNGAVQVDRDDGLTRRGQAVWAGSFAGQDIALCWSWREVVPNVIALSDPLGIKSNVVLFDERGRKLDEAKRLMSLNVAVSKLPWQATVRHSHPGTLAMAA